MHAAAYVNMPFQATEALQVDNVAHTLVVEMLKLIKVAHVFGKQRLRPRKDRLASMRFDGCE